MHIATISAPRGEEQEGGGATRIGHEQQYIAMCGGGAPHASRLGKHMICPPLEAFLFVFFRFIFFHNTATNGAAGSPAHLGAMWPSAVWFPFDTSLRSIRQFLSLCSATVKAA